MTAIFFMLLGGTAAMAIRQSRAGNLWSEENCTFEIAHGARAPDIIQQFKQCLHQHFRIEA